MPSGKQPVRETLTSVNRDGSQFFIYPADVKGFFTRNRRKFAILLIGIYLLLPWIPINGNPAVFLDVVNRRFHLFGLTLAAQDVWLLFFFLSGLAFLLFFVTAFLGRVWCGWACPQTVFLEQVFRRIERLIEGDSIARRKLDNAPWTPKKWIKRIVKHSLFFFCATLIAHIFLSYFVSIPQLWLWVTSSPTEHWKSFLFILISTAFIYGNFAWFREQLCIVICPYGRFQSALIDEDTINVAYDYNRGNPPGSVRNDSAGDCIDCHRCIKVCPTGIDIRQGLQLECIGCAACIDACDEIMEKVKRPKGLIRYASEKELEGKKTQWIRPRTFLYSLFLLVGIVAATLAFSSVKPYIATIARMSGAPFYIGEETVRNQYQVRLVNKSTEPIIFYSTAQSSSGTPIEVNGLESGLSIVPMAEENATFIVTIPFDSYQGKEIIELTIETKPKHKATSHQIEFLGPDPKLLNSKEK